MKKLNFKSKNSGFTLLEILLVIGVVAVFGVVVYATLDKVNSANAAKKEVDNLSILRAGIANGYSGQSGYPGLTALVTINGKFAPDSMVNAAGTGLINSWGGAITVTPVKFPSSATANNAFQIVYPLVPAKSCNKFVSDVASSFNRVTIGTTVVKDDSVATTKNLDVAALATQCAVDGVSVTLVAR